MSLLSTIILLVLATVSSAQSVSVKLQRAFSTFENDPQLKHASISLLVIDASSGATIFEKNAQLGLAPASTQKIITSAAAYELLGSQFRYQTKFAWDAQNKALLIYPSGDPTLGSERWLSTRPETLLEKVQNALPADIQAIEFIAADASGWEAGQPAGWVWQDMGNYYGAAPAKLNWRENQFDIFLKSGNDVGDAVVITGTHPGLIPGYFLKSLLTSAERGTGDNAYVFFPVTGNLATVKGTIPVRENRFKISAALPSPSRQCIYELRSFLSGKRPGAAAAIVVEDPGWLTMQPSTNKPDIFLTEFSPPLDSIIYWFNKKSINLYGECLLQEIAYQKNGHGLLDSGVAIMKAFWKTKGVDPLALNVVDGSGLSPMNRVTAKAQVVILAYARKQPWFKGFYNALPEYNGIKMKSGTIKDVKGFCGYHTASGGQSYIFSFLVNNYNGAHGTLVRKMYSVLNVLK